MDKYEPDTTKFFMLSVLLTCYILWVGETRIRAMHWVKESVVLMSNTKHIEKQDCLLINSLQ